MTLTEFKQRLNERLDALGTEIKSEIADLKAAYEEGNDPEFDAVLTKVDTMLNDLKADNEPAPEE